MNCPMCDSAFIGRAGVDLAGMVSWRCLDCTFFWWLTSAPIPGGRAVAARPADIAAVVAKAIPAQTPLALRKVA